jgi:polyhydroxyalkanoate synthase subunit PhaC
VLNLVPSPESVGAAAANLFDMLVGGGVADLRRTPAQILEEEPKRTVYRYLEAHDRPPAGLPVLLVPPLAAPTVCFDLRRDCSLAGHLIAEGHATYLVEYGDIAFSDRDLGLEFWIDDVLPGAIRTVSEDAGGAPVLLVGWCLGGIMSLLTAAAHPDLPLAAIATVASPFDFRQIRLMAPLRAVDELTNGFIGTAIYKTLGGAPASLVKRTFQLTSIDKYLTKPIALATHLDDRDYLAQVEAVDRFMDGMHAYPGRTIAQLYHRFFRVNDLANGHLHMGGRQIHLADVDVPVLAVAGEADVLAPAAAVHPVGELLTGAPSVRLETAPGGHLGVLAGRSARGTTWEHLDAFLTDAQAARSVRAAA